MNKKELKEIYSNLSKNIELLNNFDIKTVPTYKETITKLFLIQKNNEYKVWSEKLTDESLLSVFDKEPFWEIKDLKNSFQPAFIFENIQAWGTFIKNTEKIEFEISNYKNKTFSELFNLQKNLEFIINNERNFIFKFFQANSVKEKLLEAYKNIETNLDEVHQLDQILKINSERFTQNISNLQLEEFSSNQQKYLKQIIKDIEISNNSQPELFLMKFEKVLHESILQIKTNSKEGIANKIITLWNNLNEEESEKQNKKYPIEVLENINPEIDKLYSQLFNQFETLFEIKSISNDLLQQKYNFSQSEIKLIKTTISEIFNKGKADIFPKLSINFQSNTEKNLIEQLYRYKTYPLDLESCEKYIVEQLESIINNLQKLYQIAPNRFQLNFLTDVERNKWLNIENSLYKSYNELFKLPYQKNSIDLTKDEIKIKVDFLNDSATYYSLIESITGATKNYSPNDLPGYIVKKVNDIELNYSNLKVNLRAYQNFGAKFILNYKKVLLGDEMGLGKTIQAISVVNHLFQNNLRHTIVLCPLSVLENWNREILKWSTIPTYIFRGGIKFTLFNEWKQNGGVLLSNYEQAGTLFEKLKHNKFHFLVLDEAHYIKNPEAKRTIYSIKISKLAEYNLFMTGTPLENRLSEMKHLLKILNPNISYKIENEQLKSEEFKLKISTLYLRRKREEVLRELPELEIIKLWSKLSIEQQIFYDDALKKGLGGLMKMRRAAFWGNDSKKITQIINICNEAAENKQKVIIFSFFKEGVLYRLQNELNNQASSIISGAISPAQRQKTIDEFGKDPNQTVLLSQIDAGGVGLNIQSANIVIICEPQWKPSTEQQAIGRVYRMGQLKKVIVYRLLTEESIDESMEQLLNQKSDVFNQYANDSSIAEAFEDFERFNHSTNNTDIKQKLIEMEKDRFIKRQIQKNASASNL